MLRTARRTAGLAALVALLASCSGSSNPIGTAPLSNAPPGGPDPGANPDSNVASQDANLASVHGTKWRDDNGDGVQDPGEPGLAGVTVYVDLNTDGVLDDGEPRVETMADDPATDFDETGRYWLEDLEPGTLVIREIVPDGFVQTFPADPGTHTVDATAGATIEGIDFGNQEIPPASVHGVKWSDANGDGARDPDEPGLPGVVIYIDVNESGDLDPDEPRTTTMEDDPATDFDEAGQYWLEGLPAGTHVIREVVPDGFMQTFPANGGEHVVMLEPGERVEDLDFGNQEIEPASAHGRKWSDLDGDGARQDGEPGLAGVTIYVDANDNGALDPDELRTTTMDDDPATDFDETGMYWLEGLPPGTHIIREVVPDGFVQTFPADPGTHVIDVASGDVVEGLDFGNQEQAGVAGLKWLDLNADGVRDGDEPGIPGVTIYADLNDNGTLEGDEPSTTTMVDDGGTDFDESGRYRLGGLAPGDYVIREVVPGGFVQTFPADPGTHMVSVASGETAEGVDFGNALEGHKLDVCHNGHVINIDFHALPAHIAHGDWVVGGEGVCGTPGRSGR